MEDKVLHTILPEIGEHAVSVSVTHENAGTLFQTGLAEALQFIYMQLHPALSHYACRWVNDRTIAEDIASESFIRTWKFHAKLDSYEAIKAYLYKATGRLSQRYILKEQRRKQIMQQVFTGKENTVTPFDDLVRTETYAQLRAALKQLAPGMQRVLAMHFLEGKKLTEIAAELNLSPKTVHGQKVQGLKALRKIMPKPLVVLLLLQVFFAPL